MSRAQIRQEFRDLWKRVQTLPTGVREKVLYPVPLNILGLLCRISGGDYRKNFSFWREKLRYDGYLLAANHDEWVKQNLGDFYSLAHFYSVFNEEGGPLDIETNNEKQEKIERFLVKQYHDYQKIKEKKIPFGFDPIKWEAYRKSLKTLCAESWNDWWKIYVVYLDLLFQHEIFNLRANGKRLSILIEFTLERIPGDYETLVKMYEDPSTEFHDGETIDLLAVGLATRENDYIMYFSHRELIFNRIHRLNDLLQTGDIFYDGNRENCLFVLREESKIRLIPMLNVIFGNSYNLLLYPPEAADFVPKDRHFNPSIYQDSRLMSLINDIKINGYSILNKQGQLDIYRFISKNQVEETKGSKKKIAFATNIGELPNESITTYTSPFKIGSCYEYQKFNKEKWTDLDYKYEK